MANPDRPRDALQKAPRGDETREKAKVRKRDRWCRRPNCLNCATFHPPLHVAHWRAKGMGGDKGTRSTADQMLLLDERSHLLEQETHKLLVVIVDERRGTAGPLDFFRVQDDGTQFYEGRTEPLGRAA